METSKGRKEPYKSRERQIRRLHYTGRIQFHRDVIDGIGTPRTTILLRFGAAVAVGAGVLTGTPSGRQFVDRAVTEVGDDNSVSAEDEPKDSSLAKVVSDTDMELKFQGEKGRSSEGAKKLPRWMVPTVAVWHDEAVSVGSLFNYDPIALLAVVANESMGRSSATSPSGAQGVAQIMPTTQPGLEKAIVENVDLASYAQELGIDVQNMDPNNPLHGFFFQGVHMRGAHQITIISNNGQFPTGPIPEDPTERTKYNEQVKRAVAAYYQGGSGAYLTSGTVSSDLQQYWDFVLGIINAYADGTCPNVRALVTARWTNNYNTYFDRAISAAEEWGKTIDKEKANLDLEWAMNGCN